MVDLKTGEILDTKLAWWHCSLVQDAVMLLPWTTLGPEVHREGPHVGKEDEQCRGHVNTETSDLGIK